MAKLIVAIFVVFAGVQLMDASPLFFQNLSQVSDSVRSKVQEAVQARREQNPTLDKILNAAGNTITNINNTRDRIHGEARDAINDARTTVRNAAGDVATVVTDVAREKREQYQPAIEKIHAAAQSVIGTIADHREQIHKEAASAIDAVRSSGAEAVAAINEAVSNQTQQIRDNISKAVNDAIQGAREQHPTLDTIAGAVGSTANTIREAGKNIRAEIAEAIKDTHNAARDAAGEVRTVVGDVIREKQEKWQPAIDSIQSAANDLRSTARDTAEKIGSTIQGAVQDVRQQSPALDNVISRIENVRSNAERSESNVPAETNVSTEAKPTTA